MMPRKYSNWVVLVYETSQVSDSGLKLFQIADKLNALFVYILQRSRTLFSVYCGLFVEWEAQTGIYDGDYTISKQNV